MTISRRNPQFTIVREPVRADTAMHALPDGKTGLYAENGQYASSKGSARRRAQASLNNGDLLDGLEAMADQTLEKATVKSNVVEMQRRASSQSSVTRIEWDMGHTSIDWEPYEMIIEWDMTGEGPVITCNPHSVEIKLSKYPSIRVTFSAEYFERMEKKKIDKKI